MNQREQAAWGRLRELAPRGRYEHARSWEKRNRRRENFVAKLVVSDRGCWLWAGQKTMRRGAPYPTVNHRVGGGRSETKSAFVWMCEEFFPEIAATLPHRTSAKCGQTMCVNPFHRVNGMVTNNRISAADAVEIYGLKGKETAEGVAARFGCSANQVRAIWRGRNWGAVTGAEHQRKQRKVTPPEVVAAILERKGKVPNGKVVAAEFNVSYKTVLRIWSGTSRASLPREQAPC